MKKPTLIALLLFVLTSFSAFSQGEWIEEDFWSQNGSTEKFKIGKLRINGETYTIGVQSNLEGANLSGADLSKVHLHSSNLSGANLSGVNFEGSNLWSNDFSNVNLDGTNFSGTILSHANFTGTNCEGVNFSAASFGRTQFYDVNLTGANFSNASFSQTDFSRAVLTNSNFEGAKLSECHVGGADFTNANFKGIEAQSLRNENWLNEKELKLPENYFLYDRRILGLEVISKYLEINDSVFIGKNLNNSNLFKMKGQEVDFTGCDFSYTDLREADFTNANLTNVDFTGANLGNANLFGAIMTGANVTGVNLSGANTDGAFGLAVTSTEEQISDLITRLEEAISTINNLSANNPDNGTQEARANSVRFEVNPDSNSVMLSFDIEESEDLKSWQRTGETVTKTIQLKEGKKFYRFALDK